MDDILSLLQDFDVANFLPEPGKFLNSLEGWVRLIVLIGPLVLLCIGLWNRYVSAPTPGNRLGFWIVGGVGSMKAWHFAQKLCQMAYLVLGGGLSALMLLISLFFNAKKGMVMINLALICVILEFIVIVGAWILINMLVRKAYDKEGNPRKR
jgi:hypothetical protein